MNERFETSVLSITVSQCQTCMRDVNPTSQQGPEEEPLNNRTLNPPSSGKYSAISHTHADSGLQANWLNAHQKTDRSRLCQGCISLMAEGWNRAVLIKVSGMPSFEYEWIPHYSVLLDGCNGIKTVPDIAWNISSLTLLPSCSHWLWTLSNNISTVLIAA